MHDMFGLNMERYQSASETSTVKRGKIRALLFFTGTPHTGKNHKFLSLMQLLDETKFSAKEPLEGRLGGMDPVAAIREIGENVARFDFQNVSTILPDIGLEALRPFLRNALRTADKPLREEADGTVSFEFPTSWKESCWRYRCRQNER